MIESYSFGTMTIGGKRYNSDLKIIDGKVVPNWWRKEGHKLYLEDIPDIVQAKPDILVVGTGASGLMMVGPELKNLLAEYGISLVTDKTDKAVEIFNKFMKENRNVAGAFHLTC